MKKLIYVQLNKWSILAIFLSALLSGCSFNSDDTSQYPISEKSITDAGLTAEEISSLMYMVEEEKLAMDVYAVMLRLYDLKIFDNINQSESRHFVAVSKLIEKYELNNPTDEMPEGEFENAELQKLYNDLITLGSASKYEAIGVGVMIEEKDLRDIQYYLDNVVVREDVFQVYTNLLEGSVNHLESFLAEL
jgi:hypothetical protein